MNDYFQGAIAQHLVRGRRLIGRIPIDLPREFHVLARSCQDQIKVVLKELESLVTDPKMQRAEYQPERLRQFRRAVERLTFLEEIGIVALERGKDDKSLNQLIEVMRREICYPLLPPTVCALSQNYFHIYPGLNLMFVPLSEGDFLLHLPDIYHELGHPLIIEKDNPRTKPFQDAFFAAFGDIMAYLDAEQEKEARRGDRAPNSIAFYLQTWEKSWSRWLIEFFCDLFAGCVLGPAYAWSNFHLCAKNGDNPYFVPTTMATSHPPDDARMKALLFGLEKTGFAVEANSIKNRWKELILISGSKPEPEYHRCFPDTVLRQIAEHALVGVQGIGCKVAVRQQLPGVVTILNSAWEEFWHNPIKYPDWERDAVEQLKGLTAN